MGGDRGTALPGGLREYHWRYTPEVLRAQVPDARGVMVLTDAHLARAHDLSTWSIESLGYGRHLVQHPDLAAWYANPDPDPDVLARAREEFGPLLLKPADVPPERVAPPTTSS